MNSCADPNCVGTSETFKEVLQDLLDRYVVQVGFQNKEVSVSTLQSSTDHRKPLEIRYNKDSKPAMEIPKEITIQVPAPFPFKDTKAVPWNYDAKVIQIEDLQNKPDVTNISGTRGMTRIGRIYTPERLSREISNGGEDRALQGKDK